MVIDNKCQWSYTVAMTETEKEDKELGQIFRSSRRARAQDSKEQLWESNPEAAARLYIFDKRSLEYLGLEEWRRVAGVEED